MVNNLSFERSTISDFLWIDFLFARYSRSHFIVWKSVACWMETILFSSFNRIHIRKGNTFDSENKNERPSWDKQRAGIWLTFLRRWHDLRSGEIEGATKCENREAKSGRPIRERRKFFPPCHESWSGHHIRHQSRSLQGAVEERCVLMSIVERTNDGIVIKGLLGHFEFRIDYDLHKERNYWLIYSKGSFRRSSFDCERKHATSLIKLY